MASNFKKNGHTIGATPWFTRILLVLLLANCLRFPAVAKALRFRHAQTSVEIQDLQHYRHDSTFHRPEQYQLHHDEASYLPFNRKLTKQEDSVAHNEDFETEEQEIPEEYGPFIRKWRTALHTHDMDMFDDLLTTCHSDLQFLLQSFPHVLFTNLKHISKEMGTKLLKLIPDMNQPVTVDGFRLIHLAVDEQAPAFARLLLESGADVDVYSYRRISPLHIAAYVNDSEMFELLLGYGANVDARDWEGRTALLIAVEYGCLENVRNLLRAKADCRSADKNRFTPIWMSVASQNESILRELVHHCSDTAINVATRNDETPLHEAVYRRNPTMLSMLMAAGGDPSLSDVSGKTPSDWAREFGWKQGVEQLQMR